MMRESKKFYFSVEGETEKWYLEWLENSINKSTEACSNAKFDCKVNKNPVSRVKGMSVLSKTEITHIFDRESEEPVNIQQFNTTLKLMKKAQKIKNIKYTLGYSNFSFELWMVLHKAECNGSLSNCHQYLSLINKDYVENFSSMDEYKKKANFNRLLKKLSLSEVWIAVNRAKKITERNVKRGYILQHCCGYEYYRENPSLSIWKIIETILKDCGIPSNLE